MRRFPREAEVASRRLAAGGRGRKTRWLRRLIVLLVAILGGTVGGCTLEAPTRVADLGAFVPTPLEVAERMLEIAEVGRDDVVYDLGSGDGRIVMLAARRYGARAVGVEIDPQLVWFSRRAARRERVQHLVTFLHADAMTADISPATVVTLYLSPEANVRLRPRLQTSLRAGTRVVSHEHAMDDWPPDRVDRVRARTGLEHVLYLWRIRR